MSKSTPLRFNLPVSVYEYIIDADGKQTDWYAQAFASALARPPVGAPLCGEMKSVCVRLDDETIAKIDAVRARVGPDGSEECSRSAWASAAVCQHALGFSARYGKRRKRPAHGGRRKPLAATAEHVRRKNAKLHALMHGEEAGACGA